MMLETIDCGPDVFAVRCGGRLELAELETCLQRLKEALDSRDTTHIYAEVIGFTGLSADALAIGVKWMPEWLRRLDRVGRVALVADQNWVRWVAKVESALLPKISYETFESDERERALDWVKGRSSVPHAPAIKIIETDRPDVFGFEIDGHASKNELDAVSVHFLNALQNKDNVRVVGRIRSLGGFQMTGLVTGDYFAMKRSFLEKLERYALVGGPSWLRATLNTLAPLFTAEIRHFELEDEEAAWQWVEARPVSERTLIS
jgi:hypothetical protein